MYPSGDSSTSVNWSQLVGLDKGALDKGAGEANGSSSAYSAKSGGESGARAKLESPDEELGEANGSSSPYSAESGGESGVRAKLESPDEEQCD